MAVLSRNERADLVGNVIGELLLWSIRGGAALVFLYWAVKVVKLAWTGEGCGGGEG